MTESWEQEAQKVEQHGVRLVKARFGVVLGSQGGVLQGQKAIPKKSVDTGYTFKFETIDQAVSQLLKEDESKE